MPTVLKTGKTSAFATNSCFKSILRSWILVPFGIVVMLYFVLALDALIGLGTVSFPASVACLLILFFALLVADRVLSEKAMSCLLRVIDVPIGFALRTMNLYFTPSFILLPLSKMISGAEIGALIGVFVVGYIVQFAVTAYASRAIQFLLQRFRRRKSSKSEEDGAVDGVSELSDPPVTTHDASRHASSQDTDEKEEGVAQDQLFSDTQVSPTTESSDPRTSSQKLADRMLKHLDILIYLCIFIFIGIPVWFSTGYSMPIFLSFNILAFFAANAIPPKIKRIAHPVIITALCSVLGIWVISLTRGLSLEEGLGLYKIDANYLQYFRGTRGLPLPGAGDMLSSLLDASIVALAMPMYQYRRELRRFLLAILGPVLALTLPSLFGYPPLCFALGISATRSLAMAPRSVTLALAQLSSSNLGGDASAISPIAVVSGISGPIFGPTILRLLRIPEDDYVTTGVVFGVNSSAIATAMLLQKDRRAAALSSLSMSVLGILFVVLTVIPAIATYVRGLVGL